MVRLIFREASRRKLQGFLVTSIAQQKSINDVWGSGIRENFNAGNIGEWISLLKFMST